MSGFHFHPPFWVCVIRKSPSAQFNTIPLNFVEKLSLLSAAGALESGGATAALTSKTYSVLALAARGGDSVERQARPLLITPLVVVDIGADDAMPVT